MPNPIENPSYYTTVVIGSRSTPGYLVDITGLATAEEWVKQNGIGNIEALVWRRRPLVKGIKVICGLDGPDDEATIANWKAWYSFIAFLKPGGNPMAKPPAYTVTNSQFKGAFIKQVVYAGHTEPIFRLDQAVIGEIVLDEYRKPIALPIGPPEAAVINDSDPKPKSAQEAAFADAVARARGMNPQ
jgi:hypothetical protein